MDGKGIYPRSPQVSFGQALVIGMGAGAVGVIGMTMSNKLEQLFTNRPNSYVPGHTMGNLLGIDRDRHPDVLNHIHHWGLGMVTSTVRAGMSYYGIIGPYSSFMFMALRLLTDEVLENSAGTSSPPWTWPINEQVLDLGHKAVFAFISGYVRCKPVEGQHACFSCYENGWECSPRERKRKQPRPSISEPPTIRHHAYSETGPSPSAASNTPWEAPSGEWHQSASVEATAQRPPVSAPIDLGSHAPQPRRLSSLASNTPNNDEIANAATLYTSQQRINQSPRSTTYVGRSAYIGGDVPIDEEQAKSYKAVHNEGLSEIDIQCLKLQRAFELPPRSIREVLVDTFMTRCYPWTPIVERAWLEEREGEQPSYLLLQAVFLAASRVSSAPLAYASSEDFYRRAKMLFWLGHEKDTMIVIIATCILHWWNPDGPEHVSIDTSSFWVRIGVGLSYQIGLHKEPRPARDASLRRRLWWTLFARDCQIAAGQGRPRAVTVKDCEVRPISLDDFDEPSETAHLFVAYVGICSMLGDVIESTSRKQMSRQQRLNIENALYRWSHSLPESLQLFCGGSNPTTRPYHLEARQLHVPYFVLLTIIYRSPSPSGAPSAAALLASSFIAGIFQDFLTRDEIRFLGPIFTFYLLAAAVTQLSCYRYCILWRSAEQELRVITISQKELSKRWPSAMGALRVLQNITDAVTKQTRSNHPPLMDLPIDQHSLFDVFGPDLCREWEYIMKNAFEKHVRRPDHGQYRSTTSDLMTAGILADLKTPSATPAPDPTVPLPMVFDHHVGYYGGAVPGLGFDEPTNGHYEGIGNWLLANWSSDFS